ncbi:MAG TPA: hypothetical protein VG675_03970 [Bryobacteraceae bacterium]|nr:hypothetical protein [Bryobacteraceae bacterium]
MKRSLGPLYWLLPLFCAGILRGQTPTITSVQNESGSPSLCPGGVAFIQGTNLGSANATVMVGAKQAFVINAPAGGTSLQVQLPVDAPLGATTLKVGTSAAFAITLIQYAPGLAINNPGSFAAAIHFSSGRPVTAAFPATPNEQIGIGATGLGPTNPVFATGTSPNDSSAKVVTKPSVSIGGKAATVNDAFLQSNSPGLYTVIITVPATATTGNQNITVSIGGQTSNTGVLPVSTGAVISSISNAASLIDPSLPNGAIAEGAIAVIQGINLGPITLSVASNAFQSTTLSGTSVSVTVAGTTVAGLMYYTSATAVAFLLPSNTPIGSGTITVTYNGEAGPASPVRVSPSSPGIFTVTSDGQGAGIVTYADYSLVSSTKASNCGGVYTTCGAANPGDVLIIWATGLGPINGTDASGAGLGVNMPTLPMTILLGGVPIKADYQGRSGCCVGEDQVVFTVPPNAPTGCAVPLSLQVNNFISNSVAIPVAAAGSRTCSPADTVFTAADVVRVTTSSAPVAFGEIELRRDDNSPGFTDHFSGDFFRFTIPTTVQPFFMSYADTPPLGTCQIVNNLNGVGSDVPITIQGGGLNAGPQLTLQGPNGSKSASFSNGGYGTTLSNNGSFLTAGAYTVSAPGGPDIPAFTAPFSIPAMPVLTSPPPDAATPFAVTRSSGLTVTWSGGQPDSRIELEGFSGSGPVNTGAGFLCSVPAAAGSFTIPASILLAMPPGNFAQLVFRAFVNAGKPAVTGLDAFNFSVWYAYNAPVMFK